MKIEKLGKHTLEVYNNIDELPTERFYTYNRMLLIDSGLGSDLEAIDSHISKIQRYITEGKTTEAQQELMNMRNAFYFVTENLSPRHMSFAALVHSIDGKRVTDISEDNLRALTRQFSEWGASRGKIEEAVEAVKKKFKASWNYISRPLSRAQSKRRPTEK